MQPQKYERTTDFTERDGDDTDHASINAEFDAAALTTDQIRENLALIQRDDGALKNGIVTADALDDTAFDAVLINVNEAVNEAQQSATSALTSATTALGARDAAVAAKTTTETARDVTTLNANNASASALAALTSQTAAASSQSDANASKVASASSQVAAAASATSASTSATTATTQAGIATSKAADSLASATASASSAAGAQSAKVAAETARDGAQTARAGSEAARDTSVAAKDAAAVSQSAASSSASSAGTSATTATTKAADAVTSANSAAASATTSTAQAVISTTKATESAASAASALASKNAAAASESAAAASQVSAANSAAAAATALDNFDDRYLGPKASDPTLDNDGNALTDGALYSNTATKRMRIYFVAYGWVDASSASVATLVTYEFVATTAGQTTFSGNDANGVLLSYTVGSEMVVGNGAKLKRGTDYTASTGSSIVLAEGLGIGQELSVLAFGNFAVADTYLKSEADARFVNVTGDTMTGPLVIKQSQGTAYGGWATILNLNGFYPGYDEDAIRATIDSGIPSVGTQNTTYGQIGLATRGSDGLNRRIVIGSYGNVNMPYQTCFCAYNTNGATSATLSFNATSANVGNCFNTSNGRFTAPVDGKYVFTIGGLASNSAVIGIKKNGSFALPGGASQAHVLGVGSYATISKTVILTLVAGDYVEAACTQSSVYLDWMSFTGQLIS